MRIWQIFHRCLMASGTVVFYCFYFKAFCLDWTKLCDHFLFAVLFLHRPLQPSGPIVYLQSSHTTFTDGTAALLTIPHSSNVNSNLVRTLKEYKYLPSPVFNCTTPCCFLPWALFSVLGLCQASQQLQMFQLSTTQCARVHLLQDGKGAVDTDSGGRGGHGSAKGGGCSGVSRSRSKSRSRSRHHHHGGVDVDRVHSGFVCKANVQTDKVIDPLRPNDVTGGSPSARRLPFCFVFLCLPLGGVPAIPHNAIPVLAGSLGWSHTRSLLFRHLHQLKRGRRRWRRRRIRWG